MNLALACHHCNLHNGPNLSGIDPDSGKTAILFNPRIQKWNRHFIWSGPILLGRTQIGRATIFVLAINGLDRVALRTLLIRAGEFPLEQE